MFKVLALHEGNLRALASPEWVWPILAVVSWTEHCTWIEYPGLFLRILDRESWKHLASHWLERVSVWVIVSSCGDCKTSPRGWLRLEDIMWREIFYELWSSVQIKYATGDQWGNNSRKKEGMEPKQKQCPVVDGTGDRSKVWCCKEQYCIGTWNVRSMIKANWKWSNRRWQEWMSTF